MIQPPCSSTLYNLSGRIETNISCCRILSNNLLYGNLDPLLAAKGLIYLLLSNNQFNGTLQPFQTDECRLKSMFLLHTSLILVIRDLANNRLTGDIPNLFNCTTLSLLFGIIFCTYSRRVNNNQLNGTIFAEFPTTPVSELTMFVLSFPQFYFPERLNIIN